MATWILIFDHVTALVGLIFVTGVLLSHYQHLEARVADEQVRRARRVRDSIVVRLMTMAGGFALVILALAFQTRGFFSAGQHAAWGILAGVLAGLVATLLCAMLSEAIRQRLQLAKETGALTHVGAAGRLCVAMALAMVSPSIFGCAVLLAVFPMYPQDAMTGMALGAVLVTVVVRFGLSILAGGARGARVEELTELSAAFRPLELFCIFSVALGVATFLAAEHFTGSTQVPTLALWAIPASLGGLGIIGGLIAQPFASLRAVAGQPGTRTTVVALITAAVIAGIVALLAPKFDSPKELSLVTLLGVVTALLLMLLVASAGARGGLPLARMRNAVVGTGLVLLTVAVCFKLLAGFGVGLALLAAVLILAVSAAVGADRCEEERPLESTAQKTGNETVASAFPQLVGCISVGLGYGIFRVFLQRYPDAQRMDVSTHYVFLGMLAGVALMMVVATSNRITAKALSGAGWGQTSVTLAAWAAVAARIGFTGLLALALCAALNAVWGHKAALGIVCSLPIGVFFVLALDAARPGNRDDMFGPGWSGGLIPLLLGVGLFAAQITGPWDFLMGLTVRQKSWVMVSILVVAVIWVLIDAYLLSRAGEEEAP